MTHQLSKPGLRTPRLSPRVRRLVENQTNSYLFEFDDRFTLWQDTGGATQVTDGAGVARADDLGPHGANLLQSVGAEEPPFLGSGVLDFNGSTHSIGLAFNGGAGPSDCSVFASWNLMDTQAILYNQNAGLGTGAYFGVVQDGQAAAPYQGAGNPNHYVNGTMISPNSRDGLHTALATGGFECLEARSCDLSLWANFNLSAFQTTGNAWRADAQLARLAIVPSSLADEHRALFEDWSVEAVI